jgi:hypothetical protein
MRTMYCTSSKRGITLMLDRIKTCPWFAKQRASHKTD